MAALDALGIDVAIIADAQRAAGRDAVRRGPGATRLRPGDGARLLARARRRPTGCSSAFRAALPRQGQPGALLLGQLRPGGDAVLRPPAPRIRAACRICPTRSRARPTRTRCRSAGFWPGGESAGRARFYSYAYPAPAASPRRGRAGGGALRATGWASSCCPTRRCGPQPDPDAALLAFLQSTYEAAADLAPAGTAPRSTATRAGSAGRASSANRP